MNSLKSKLYEIIFEADTKAGKWFDIILIVLILLSIIIVMMESDSRILSHAGSWITLIEWGVTILFAIEYLLRIWILEKPEKYIFSFYGIILICLPSYHLL